MQEGVYLFSLQSWRKYWCKILIYRTVKVLNGDKVMLELEFVAFAQEFPIAEVHIGL